MAEKLTPDEFAEMVLGVRLMLWQKIRLRWFSRRKGVRPEAEDGDAEGPHNCHWHPDPGGDDEAS